MSNLNYLDMEDVAFKDWSDHLDFVANSHVNPWLPAYGYHPTSTVQEIFNSEGDPFVIDNSSVTSQQYLVLETIVEETSDDLRSESDKSGPAGWNSDSDADSVIHLPKIMEKTGSWKLMDNTDDLPKRKKRRMVEKFSLSDDDEHPENIETTSLSSRSSSLIAFESLEKHCEDVFVTNMTNNEFTPCNIFENIKRFSTYSDSPRESRDEFESSDEEYGFNSSADTLLRPYKCFRVSLSNGHRLKSYRSFDSLNLFENDLDVNYVLPELSQSQTALDYEKEKLQEQEFVIRDKKLTATTADLSSMTDPYENDFRMILPKRKKDSASFHFKKFGPRLRNSPLVFREEPQCIPENYFLSKTQSYGSADKKPQFLQEKKSCGSNNFQNSQEKSDIYSNAAPKSQFSAENLSEDSGFDDQIPSKNKASSIKNSRNLNIPETEDSSFSESSNFSDFNGSEEVISLDALNVSNLVNKNSDSLKITEKQKQEGKHRLQIWDDVDVKINTDPSKTQTFNCIRDKKGAFKMGDVEKLIAVSSVPFAASASKEFRCSFCCSDNYSEKSEFGNSFFQHDCLNKNLTNKWFSENVIGGLENSNGFLQNEMNMKSEKNAENARSKPSKFSNLSTPNLFDGNENFIQRGPSNALSLSHVPLKYYDENGDKMEEIKSRLLDFGKTELNCDFEKQGKAGGIKGVHFHPVVSEVSWKDSFSDNYSDSSSVASVEEPPNRSLEELCEIKNDEEDFHEAEEKSIPKYEKKSFEIQKAQPYFNFNFKNTSEPNLLGIYQTNIAKSQNNSVLEQKSEKDLNNENKFLNASGDRFEIETFVKEKPVTPTILESSTSCSHVFAIDAAQANAEKKTRLSVSSSNLLIEERDNVARTSLNPLLSTSKEMTTKKPKNRLGGFLERFSFRRLSNRINNPAKRNVGKKEKKPKEEGNTESRGTSDNHQEAVTIIPLHGPENEEEINEIFRSVVTPHVVSAKPPLPPSFQRMPGGSRKRFSFLENPSAELQDDDSNKKGNMPGGKENVSVDNYPSTNIVQVNPSGNVRPKREIFEKSVGLLETDLDTHITVESTIREPLVQSNGIGNKKARSLMNLGLQEMNGHHKVQNLTPGYLEPSNYKTHGLAAVDDRAKSMEFLLDKENQVSILPPENELQKGGTNERVLSEHQLRFQRSIQKLNIPEWYKNSALSQTPQGFLLKRNSDAGRERPGWPGLSFKTTSLSSLGSSRSATAKCLNHVLSPSPTSHLFTRWSTSRLNSGFYSASTSPSYSARSSFNYRQPYLGWRSQEKLTKPRTPAERLAADLLPLQKRQTSTQPNNQLSQTSLNPNLSDVRTSIKEVTSAIVHYVSGVQDNDPRENLKGSQASPKWQSSPRGSTGRLCWLESSFVGSRPLDQPETPLNLAESSNNKSEMKPEELHLDLKPFTPGNPGDVQRLNETSPTNLLSSEEKLEKSFEVRTRLSPASTTLDDILESLLGLPPTSRSPSPAPLSVTSAVNACTPGRSFSLLPLPDNQQRRLSGDVRANISGSVSDPGNADFAKQVKICRRKSEIGLKLQESSDHLNRKVEENTQENKDVTSKKDLHSQLAETLVKCRYSKCGKTATVLDAKRTFKTCHNCAHVYCSRECRRAHWERHRRTCLHSRVGALCKQVLIAAKEDAKTLNLISLLARRGYVTHGRGAVKIFFSSPELAENFVARGNDELSEPAYVKWSDLLPAEMGADLFGELTKLCKSYNPDTRLVLYVAICVVSEVPTSGAVKWERQLVSRCCKIPLDKSLIPPKPEKQIPPPLPPRKTSSNSINITRDMENPETLILTSLPGIAGKISEEKIRQISFTNIQRELKVRGVSLRRQFPEVYKNLCSYVEGTSEHFTPVTIYPRDVISGKTFMCIIMPESEPEKLDLVPKDSTRVKTVDIGVERTDP